MMKRNIHALEVSDSIIQGLYKQCLLPDGTKPFIWTSVDQGWGQVLSEVLESSR